jgi:hypothetical protein
MRNTFILSVLLICNLMVSAQSFSLTEGQPALVYSLPKTKLCAELEIEKVNQKPGVFYRYSERYLATSNVIVEEKITYRLKSVAVKAIAVPDSTRTYQISPDKSSQLTHLCVNSQGILCGINVAALAEKTVQVNKTILRNNGPASNLLPLGEEYMMAGSEAKLAEGAAKQIYRIRESRLGLLTADVEKIPADGASMKSMLEGLDNMERQLTELFVGSTNVDVQGQKIYLTPAARVNNDVLFRLSALRGLVAPDDLSGTPYYISIKPQMVTVKTDPKANAGKAGLYYVLPASTDITISDGVNTNFSGQFYIPQFGKTVPLPESLFKQSNMKVRIDSQTGRLLSIE